MDSLSFFLSFPLQEEGVGFSWRRKKGSLKTNNHPEAPTGIYFIHKFEYLHPLHFEEVRSAADNLG
jgi:hypothetical protein